MFSLVQVDKWITKEFKYTGNITITDMDVIITLYVHLIRVWIVKVFKLCIHREYPVTAKYNENNFKNTYLPKLHLSAKNTTTKREIMLQWSIVQSFIKFGLKLRKL